MRMLLLPSNTWLQIIYYLLGLRVLSTSTEDELRLNVVADNEILLPSLSDVLCTEKTSRCQYFIPILINL